MSRRGDLEAAITELVQAAQFATTERFTPGLSIAVAGYEDDGRRVVHCQGFGVKQVGGAEAPGPDTLFPCASLSKPVSATLIAAKRQGRWNDSVEPERLARSERPVTLADWLSHTSGLPDHAGDLIEDMNPAMPRDEIIRNIIEHQTGLDPSRTYAYTNFGFTMGCLGAMKELGATNWETFADEGLHDLGMHRSTYAFTSAFAPNAGDRVLPHKGEPGTDARGGWTWRVVERQEERNPSRQAPAGSLMSSANDMAQFIDAHLQRRFGDYPMRSTTGMYALGWNVDTNPAGGLKASHSGAFSLGASTCLRIDPDSRVGVAILTNGEPAGVPESLIHIFFTRLYSQPSPGDYATVLAYGRAEILAGIYKQKEQNRRDYASAERRPIPPALPEGEVFRGRSDYYGCDVAIDRTGDELWLSMGNSGDGQPFWRFALSCYADDDSARPVFVYQTAGENEVGISAVELEIADGKVRTITDRWLDLVSPERPSGTGVGVIRARCPAASL